MGLSLLLLLAACGEEDPAYDQGYAAGYQDALAAQAETLAALGEQLAALQAQVDELEGEAASQAWVEEQGYASSELLAVAFEDLESLRDGLYALEDRVETVEEACLARDEVDTAALADLFSVLEVDLAGQTVALTGVNLHLRSGSGASDDGVGTGGSPLGLGNLVLGYDEAGDGDKTGSHNLVLGPGHAYTGTGGLVAGQANSISGQGASVLGGTQNSAEGLYAVVVAGKNNTVSGDGSVVVAGDLNTASGHWSAVLGGYTNTVAGFKSTISGGSDNETGTFWHCAILGGLYQRCDEDHDTVF